MTNREVIITGLQENDWEIDRIITGFIECPYVLDSDCENPYKYGTSDFQIFCDEHCKTEWLDKECDFG